MPNLGRQVGGVGGRVVGWPPASVKCSNNKMIKQFKLIMDVNDSLVMTGEFNVFSFDFRKVK